MYKRQPPKGDHWYSSLPVLNLPKQLVHAVWDGGAEGTTVSIKCASRLLRAQADLPEDQRAALVDLGRQPLQRFHGFADQTGQYKKVDVNGWLRLTAPGPNYERLPELQVRIVDQVDDLLIAAPDLDRIGFSPHPEYFSIASCGVAIQRETEEHPSLRLVRQ